MSSLSICSHCLGGDCQWLTYREDLIRYWLECRQRGRPFGDLGKVADCNRHV